MRQPISYITKTLNLRGTTLVLTFRSLLLFTTHVLNNLLQPFFTNPRLANSNGFIRSFFLHSENIPLTKGSIIICRSLCDVHLTSLLQLKNIQTFKYFNQQIKILPNKILLFPYIHSLLHGIFWTRNQRDSFVER